MVFLKGGGAGVGGGFGGLVVSLLVFMSPAQGKTWWYGLLLYFKSLHIYKGACSIIHGTLKNCVSSRIYKHFHHRFFQNWLFSTVVYPYYRDFCVSALEKQWRILSELNIFYILDQKIFQGCVNRTCSSLNGRQLEIV